VIAFLFTLMGGGMGGRGIGRGGFGGGLGGGFGGGFGGGGFGGGFSGGGGGFGGAARRGGGDDGHGTHRKTSHGDPLDDPTCFPGGYADRYRQGHQGDEAAHRGEIRFAVEGALHIEPLLRGQTRENARSTFFPQLRIWDTERNNGVLIYMLLAERDVEIVADRGIGRESGSAGMGEDLPPNGRRFSTGGLRRRRGRRRPEVTRHLAVHFPPIGDDRDRIAGQNRWCCSGGGPRVA